MVHCKCKFSLKRKLDKINTFVIFKMHCHLFFQGKSVVHCKCMFSLKIKLDKINTFVIFRMHCHIQNCPQLHSSDNTFTMANQITFVIFWSLMMSLGNTWVNCIHIYAPGVHEDMARDDLILVYFDLG